MKKINGFQIICLSVSGFKCFENKVTFDFGDLTHITAANGLGKSSIADAISFAFTGTPFFGDRGLDRLQNKNMRELEVSVDFIDDTGTTHNITRTRKRDVTSIILDGLNIRQTDMNTVFGDKDVFLSIFNPLYFINILGDDGKNLLEKLLPVVRHEDVLAALSEPSRDILANQSLLSPEIYIKNRRAELRELEETLISYRGQQELLEYQRKERTANLNELKSALERTNADITELESIRDKDRDPNADKDTLIELHINRDDLFSDYVNGDENKALLDITTQIKRVESIITEQATKPYVSGYTSKIAKAEAEVSHLYAEHKRLSDALNNTVVGYKCSVCMSEITDNNISVVKSDLQRRLSALVGDGKKAKALLSELQRQDNAAMREFEKHKADTLAAAQTQLEELNRLLQERQANHKYAAQRYNEKLAVLNSQISLLEHKVAHGNLSLEQVRLITDLESVKREHEAKIDALNNLSSNYDYATLIAETEAEAVKLKRLVYEAINYAATRAELMFSKLKMNKAAIVLSEVIKTTGEVKDCFRLSYDGRDYKCLSLSEKIKAGLEVSELIKRLSGREYPIFIDNSESVCAIDNVRPTGQVILARVVKGEELRVSYKNNELRKVG